MSVMDFVGKKVDFRRKGFSSSEVLLSLLAIGIVIAIFTSLNNFGGVKTQEQKVKLDKFENAIVSVQRSLVNNPEVSAQKACDVEFLKNYYLENLSNSKELDDFQINSTNVKAIKVDGYGVLAILPNADNNYCKEMWEKDELNVSNPPVAFVAISEDMASNYIDLNEIKVNDQGKFLKVNEGAEFGQENNIIISANKATEERMDNSEVERKKFYCNTEEEEWAAKNEFQYSEERNLSCKIGSPFNDPNNPDNKITELCCVSKSPNVLQHVGYFSFIPTNGQNCEVTFCEGNGFETEEDRKLYLDCVENENKDSCSKVKIIDTGRVNLVCRDNIYNYNVCVCPKDKKYWVPKDFILKKKLLGYKENSYIHNGFCISDCKEYKNENGESIGLVGNCENDKVCSCTCPEEMEFNQTTRICECIVPLTEYKNGKCVCPDDMKMKDNKCKCKNSEFVYNETAKKCDCPDGKEFREGKCLEKLPDCNPEKVTYNGYDIKRTKNSETEICECEAYSEELVSKIKNTLISKKAKYNNQKENCYEECEGENSYPNETFTQCLTCDENIAKLKKENDKYSCECNSTKVINLLQNDENLKTYKFDNNLSQGCKYDCSSEQYKVPSNDKKSCVCDELLNRKDDGNNNCVCKQESSINLKSYEYRDTNSENCKSECSVQGNIDKTYLKANSETGKCICHNSAKEAIEALEKDNASTNALKGFKNKGDIKYNDEGWPESRWNKTKPETGCMSACPSAQECASQDKLYDPINCGCKDNDTVITDIDITKCPAGSIAIYDTQTLQAIGNIPQYYPLNGIYCLINDININPEEVTNEKLLNILGDYDKFIPIGQNDDDGFEGAIYGQGNSITGLDVEDLINNNGGLISVIGEDGKVNDLTIEGNVTVDKDNCSTNPTYAGILTGENLGTITNVNVTGSVTGCNIGGLVGNNEGTITNSSASGTVDGNNAGGLVGDNNGTIEDSSVTGTTTVKGEVCAAGFAAVNNSTITDSYTDSVKINSNSSANGFTCTNSGTINYSYVKKGTIDGNTSSGFVGTNEGTISKTYTEEATIKSVEKSAGFVNTNSNTISDTYVFGNKLNSGSTGISTGFVNDNEGTIQNVYAISDTISGNTQTGFINNVESDYIPSNVYWAAKDDIASCTTNNESCNQINKRNEIDFNSTPSTEIYNQWPNDTWCFSCSKRARLRGMPNETISICTTDTCPYCTPEGCSGNQQKTGEDCHCSCENVSAQTAYEKLSVQQKKWYKNQKSNDGYICLACGSYEEGNYKFDYKLITTGENKGYCGCPPQEELPAGYLNGYNYVSGNAKDDEESISCRIQGDCNITCETGYVRDLEKCRCVKSPINPDTGSAYCPDNAIAIPGNDDNAKTYYKENVKLLDGENKNTIEIPTNSEEVLNKIGKDKKYPKDGKYCLLGNINVNPSKTELAHIVPATTIQNQSFMGEFYGTNHTISGVKITNTTGVYVGFFNDISDFTTETGERKRGKVRNLTIEGNVIGKNTNCGSPNTYAGILAGRNVGEIENVTVKGSVKGCITGGVVGNNGGALKNVKVIAAVSGQTAGGVGGILSGTTINCSVEEGTVVNGTYCAGGFAAIAYKNISKSYTNKVIVKSEQYAGGFVCKNGEEGIETKDYIRYCYVNKGTVTGKDAAGFVAMNNGNISSVFVDGTEVKVNNSNDNKQNAAGFVYKNTNSIKNAYINEISLTGGAVSGFASKNESSIENVYAILNNEIVSKSINGFVPDISNGSAITNSYWGIKDGFEGDISSCSSKDNENCEVIKRRKVTQFNSTPNENIYNTWNAEINKGIWCFSCSDKAVLIGMPKGAPAAKDCAKDGCPLVCEEMQTPDKTKFNVDLIMDNNGDCNCPSTCADIDAIVLSLKYDYPFECDPDSRGMAQDVKNNQYCLQYKCEFVDQIDDLEQAPIRLERKAPRYSCACPSAEKFADYLAEHEELMYDNNWDNDEDNPNFSCLTYRCDKVSALSDEYNENKPDVRLVYKNETCGCPEKEAFAEYLAKNPTLEYDTDWNKDITNLNLSCLREKPAPQVKLCGSEYQNCHQEGNIYRCNKIVKGEAANDERCSSGYIPICSMTELQKIGVDADYKMDECYLVMDDLTAKEPINKIGDKGDKTPADFKGVFDGDNHKISNLSIISDENKGSIGLFARLAKAKILNLDIDYEDTLVGSSRIGCLAGSATTSAVENCNIKCNIDVNNNTNSYTGGLIGNSKETTIINCYADVNIITNGAFVGGLVGNNTDGTITNCSATGGVSGNSRIGGLIGNNDGRIVNCSTDVNVKSENNNGNTPSNVGGLIGWNKGEIIDCSSVGNVIGNKGNVGGLIGYNSSARTITNCFATGDVIGGNDVGGLIGYNSSAGTITNCFATGNIVSNGYSGGLIGDSNAKADINDCYATGDVTGSGYIGGLIGNSNSNINKCFAKGKVIYKEGSIKGLFIGGLVGDSYGSIAYSYATGDVIGGNIGSDVGGLVGRQSNKGIIYSYATGNVSGKEYIGGLVGSLSSFVEVSNSYAIGNVTGTHHTIGGLVGRGGKVIINTYAKGNVSGKNYIGGLVGSISASSCKITNSYVTGDVTIIDSTNNSPYVGSLSANKTEILNSYASGTVNSSSKYKSFAGMYNNNITNSREVTLEELQSTRTDEIFIDWDDSSVWCMACDATPTLKNMPEGAEQNPTCAPAGGCNNNPCKDKKVSKFENYPETNIEQAYNKETEECGCPAAETFAEYLNTHTDLKYDENWKDNKNLTCLTYRCDKVSALSDEYNENKPDVRLVYNKDDNSCGCPSADDSTIKAYLAKNPSLEYDTDWKKNNNLSCVREKLCGWQYDNCHYENGIYRCNKIVKGETANDERCSSGYIPICSMTELQKIGVDANYKMDKCYLVMTDLQAKEAINTIGDKSVTRKFKGVFDGNNYKISNLSLNTDDLTDYAGLFSHVDGAKILDLSIDYKGNLIGQNYVGGLVGADENSSYIQNCHVKANIFGDSNIGGLVGYGKGGVHIINSSVTGNITGSDGVGGLVGRLDLASKSVYITNSYTTTDIIGNNNVGGLVGGSNQPLKYNYNITNSYTTGNVIGNKKVGGLVGSGVAEISDSYTTGYVTGSSIVGGLAGHNTGTISNCYATGDVTGYEMVGGLIGLSGGKSSTEGGYCRINKCYAKGKVSYNGEIKEDKTGSKIGGLVGRMQYTNINNSYATGNVIGGQADYVGSFVGTIDSGNITNSYATGSAAGNLYVDNWRGGVGRGYTYKNCYAKTYEGAQSTNSIKYLPLEEMYSSRTDDIYKDWDDETIWCMSCDATPTLRDMPEGAEQNSTCAPAGGCNNNPCKDKKVSKFENYPETNIEQSYNIETKECGCPAAEAFTEYLNAHADLKYDENWKDNKNLTCLTYRCDKVNALNDEYNENKLDVRLVYNSQDNSCGCPSADDSTIKAYLAKNPSLEYDTDWKKNNNLSCVREKLCGWQYDNCHYKNGIYRCDKIVKGEAANDERCSSGYIPICSMTELQKIGVDANYKMDECYLVMTDLQAKEAINKIGDKGDKTPADFKGVFDGDNHKISNLSIISDNKKEYVGFFASVEDAKISNLSVNYKDTLIGQIYVGGLAGIVANSNIQNCSTNANVNVNEHNSVAGSLIGQVYESVITDSYATGNVTGYFAGGLIGVQEETSVISNCYATGNITGKRSAGGLVGYSGNGIISDCYASGTVTGKDGYAGGLIGGSGFGTINNSHATGNIIGESFDTGGFIGSSIGDIINNCYAEGDVTGKDYTGGFAGFVGYGTTLKNSYSKTGRVKGKDTVGGFVGFYGEADSSTIESCYSTENAEGENYVGGFAGNIKDYVNKSYATGNVKGKDYVGGFAGNLCEDVNKSYATGNVKGKDYVGGFAGYANSFNNITNCYTKTDIDAEGSFVGGFLGYMNVIYINNSYVVYKNSDSNKYPFIGGGSYQSTYIKNNYAQTYENAPDSTDSVKYLPLEEMYSSRTDDIYKDWDDETIWCMACDATPTLKNMPEGAEQNSTCAPANTCTRTPEIVQNNNCPAYGKLYIVRRDNKYHAPKGAVAKPTLDCKEAKNNAKNYECFNRYLNKGINLVNISLKELLALPEEERRGVSECAAEINIASDLVEYKKYEEKGVDSDVSSMFNTNLKTLIDAVSTTESRYGYKGRANINYSNDDEWQNIRNKARDKVIEKNHGYIFIIGESGTKILVDEKVGFSDFKKLKVGESCTIDGKTITITQDINTCYETTNPYAYSGFACVEKHGGKIKIDGCEYEVAQYIDMGEIDSEIGNKACDSVRIGLTIVDE